MTPLKHFAAVAASLAFATTAVAQDSSYTPGSYWSVSMIDIVSGQEEIYLDYMAG